MLPPARILARVSCVARTTVPRTAVAATTSFATRRNVHRDEHQNAWKDSGDRYEPKSDAEPLHRYRKTSASRGVWPKFEIPEDAKQIVCEQEGLYGGPITVSWTPNFVVVEDRDSDHGRRALKPATLRDGCSCSKCRDPNLGIKNFATTEIPVDIGIENVRPTDEGLAITFSRDIERLAKDGHETILPWSSVEITLKRKDMEDMYLPRKRSILRRTGVQYWDSEVLEKQLRRIDYEEYMQDGEAFWDVVIDLCRFGIVFLKNVPKDEESIVRITTRMANFRETFYGRAFDVRATPNAEDVTCTSGPLGLRQDLLYLEMPPLIRVLHCIENSFEGGESLFSDGERVGRLLHPFSQRPKMAPLVEHHIPYQYNKDGYHYFSSRFVINQNEGGFTNVFWSPPAQGRYLSAAKDIRRWIEPARIFEGLINDEKAVYRRKLEPGECVLIDNLRVLHGRTAFDVAAEGGRWLRGSYIAAEDFLSRAARIPKGQAEKYRGAEPWTSASAQRQLKGSEWHRDVVERIKAIDPGVRA